MVWTGQVARMEDMINAYEILIGIPQGKKPLKDLGVDRRITLEWM